MRQLETLRAITAARRPGWQAGHLLAVFLIVANSSVCSAASVKVEGDRPSQNIKVHIDGASVERALGVLAEKYGFEFIRPESGRASPALTATLSGNLETVLARLLRNRNHAIVRAGDAPGGIRRVVLIDRRLGSNLKPGERPGYRRATPPARKAAKSTRKTAPEQSGRTPK